MFVIVLSDCLRGVELVLLLPHVVLAVYVQHPPSNNLAKPQGNDVTLRRMAQQVKRMKPVPNLGRIVLMCNLVIGVVSPLLFKRKP